MSQTEHFIGILIPVKLYESETLEEAAGRILDSEGYKIDHEWYATALEALEDDFQEKYTVVAGNIYRVKKKDYEEEDIFLASKNNDGTISFTVKYYNGGCGFDEAIELAFKQLKETE